MIAKLELPKPNNMRPIFKDYRIIETGDRWELPSLVCDFLREGWMPVGGIHVDERNRYYQAMVLPVNLTEDDLKT